MLRRLINRALCDNSEAKLIVLVVGILYVAFVLVPLDRRQHEYDKQLRNGEIQWEDVPVLFRRFPAPESKGGERD